MRREGEWRLKRRVGAGGECRVPSETVAVVIRGGGRAAAADTYNGLCDPSI